MRRAIIDNPLLRAWGNRRFVLLWGGQAISRLGDHLYEIVLAWWVLTESGSPAALATVLLCSLVPTLLLALFGGVIVDRYPRIPIMVGSDVLRGAVSLLVAWLAFDGGLTLWHVYALSMLFGAVDALFQPAFAATLPTLVRDEQLPSANSLTSLAIQTGRVLGPPLGAGLIALGGTPLAFAINGVSFFGSALLMLPLLRGAPTQAAPTQAAPTQAAPTDGDGTARAALAQFSADLRAGLRTVRGLPWLMVSIAAFGFANITLTGPYSVAMPFLVTDVLKADVGLLGVLYALFAVGYVLGGVWLGRAAVIRRRGLWIHGGLAVAGGMLLLFGLPVGLPLLMAAALINGAALEVATLAWTNALQTRVPREMLGRVASVDTLGSLALLPIGLALTGVATEAWGAAAVFVVGGGSTLLLGLLLVRLPAIRGLD